MSDQRHRWTNEEDDKVMEAYEKCLPFRDGLDGSQFWASVYVAAGITTTTIGGVKARYERLSLNSRKSSNGKVSECDYASDIKDIKDIVTDIKSMLNRIIVDLGTDSNHGN